MKKGNTKPSPLYKGWSTRIDWHSPELAALVAFNVLPRGRALDFGCGHGTESLFLADMGWTVLGIDNDPDALRLAQKRRDRAPLRVQSRVKFKRRNALKFKEHQKGTFDLAIDRLLTTNLGTSAARSSALNTLARALRIDGVLVLRIGIHVHPLGLRFPLEGFFEEDDLEVLRRYFRPTHPFLVGYQGLITPSHDGENRVVANYPMGIAILRRNDTPWGTRAH